MRSIYKYDIMNNSDGIITGPITKIISAAEQHGRIVVWAEVDTTAPERKFQVFPIGTGWPLDPPEGKECMLDTYTFLNTIMMAGGTLVFHIYYNEITPKPVTKKEPTPVKKAVDRAEYKIESTMINPEILKVFTR